MPRTKVDAIPSFGALLRSDTERREARLPNPGDLPLDIAWYRDPRLGHIPAVVVLTGILTKMREVGTGEDLVRQAQWAICHGPDHDRIRERMSRRDVVDAVQMVIDFLSRLDPMLPRGTTFTVSFSVPKENGPSAGESYFDVSFDASTAFRRANRLRPHAFNPWDNATRVAEIKAKIAGLLRMPVMGLWKSWTDDPGVRMILQGVPFGEDRSIFRPGDVQRVIRERLPPELQRTMFVGYVPTELLAAESEPEPEPESDSRVNPIAVILPAFALLVALAVLFFALF